MALWRVVQNIPAYVPCIREIYEQAASAIASVPDFTTELAKFISGQEGAYKSAVQVSTSGWGDIGPALEATTNGIHNHIIDVISQFRSNTWEEFINVFKEIANPNVINTITESSNQIADANSFLGMNIGDNPSFTNITVLVPVLSVVTQIINTKIATSSNPSNKAVEENNQTMKTMKVMNNVMPLVSGFMCLVLPIGIGIYWITGNIFRTIQQIFVNHYMDKMDVEELRQKNLEKMEKKNARREKMGIPTTPIQDAANMKTNSIENVAKKQIKTPEPKKNYEPKDYQKQEFNPNSISSIANMLNNKDHGKK